MNLSRLKSKKKPCVVHPKRHIEDAPFYSFKYEVGELPLDPAKEFILNKIGKYILYQKLSFLFLEFTYDRYGNGFL